MMRKIIFVFMFVCFIFKLSSETYSPFRLSMDLFLGPDTLLLFREKGYFASSLWDTKGSYSSFSKDNISIGVDSFPRVNLLGTEFIIVYGGRSNFIFYSPEKSIGLKPYVLTTSIPIVKTASSSSFLSETIGNQKIDYTPENLITSTIEDIYLGTRHWNLNNNLVTGDPDSYPWVEGVDGYGVEEWIEIEFTKPIDTFSILNGYIDPRRPHLYNQNSRVKRMRIESIDASEKYDIMFDIKDEVSFQTIVLPRITEKVRMTIDDVYPGSKYEDTVITGIFEVPTSDELKLSINKYISFERMLETYTPTNDQLK